MTQPYDVGPPQPPKPNLLLRGIPLLGVIAITVGALVGGFGAGALAFSGGSSEPVTASNDAPRQVQGQEPTSRAEEPEPAYTPTPDDFELTVKTLEKKCFGPAGCNVTFRIELGYGGVPLDPSTEYEVTYEVRGGEDGPQINTLTVRGEEYETDREELITTSSSDAELEATVTDVTEM